MDDASTTISERSFQIRPAATPKARSPSLTLFRASPACWMMTTEVVSECRCSQMSGYKYSVCGSGAYYCDDHGQTNFDAVRKSQPVQIGKGKGKGKRGFV